MGAQFNAQVFGQTAVVGQFGTPLNISADSYNARGPAVAASGNYAYVAWSEATHGIYLRVSSDDGTTFSPALRLSPFGGVASYPVMSANGSYVYVAWSQTASNNNISQILFTYSTDYGNSFSTAAVLSGTSNAVTPIIASWNSTVYVSWNGYTAQSNGTFVRTSTDAGASFYPTFQASVGLRENAIAAYGTYGYIVYDGGGYAFTNDSGAVWASLPLQIGGNNPTIAVSGQYVYVASEVRVNSRVPNIALQVSTDYGQSFGSVINPNGNVTTNDWYPQLAASGTSVYVAFLSYYPGYTWIVGSGNNGTTWNAPYQTSPSNFSMGPPIALVATPSGAFSMYSGATNGSSNVWNAYVSYTNNSGVSWNPAPGVDVSQNNFGFAAPYTNIVSASIAGSGPYDYVAWMQNETTSNSTNYQVFFNGPFASSNSTIPIITQKCCSLVTTTNSNLPTVSSSASVSPATSLSYPSPSGGFVTPPPAIILDLIAGAIVVGLTIALAALFLRRRTPASPS